MESSSHLSPEIATIVKELEIEANRLEMTADLLETDPQRKLEVPKIRLDAALLRKEAEKVKNGQSSI